MPTPDTFEEKNMDKQRIAEFKFVLQNADNWDNDMAAAGMEPPIDPIEWLSTTLAEVRKETIEKIENKLNGFRTPYPGNYDSAFDTGYHDCIDAVRLALDQMKK